MYSAIVTGGSGEIGSEICRKLCEKGYAVAVCYNTDRISAEELVAELVSAGYSAEAVKCDVRDPSQIREAVHRASLLGDLAVAVNCAGTALYAQIQDTDDEAVQDIFAANSIGAYLLCREAAKHMIPSHYGRIVSVSSMWGISGGSCESAYSASKSALTGMTRALAKELGPSGITVNCVAPGLIDTKMNSRLSASDIQALVEDTPVCRIGTAEDVADAVIFFCDSPFITGQVLLVDGGFSL